MPRIRNQGKHGRPTWNQASKIVAKFGGESQLAKIIDCSRISVYRWSYRPPYGSDGLIPNAAVTKINSLARLHGVLITERDWIPEKIRYEEETI